MIADCSLIFGAEKMFYLLIALGAAYARRGKQLRSDIPSPEPIRLSELRPRNGAKAVPASSGD
jgi:hypothetical protein